MSRSPEDREAWARVAAGATPLKGRPAPPKARRASPEPPAKTPALSQPSPLPRKRGRPEIDRTQVDKIVRGDLPLEARLDLHGLSERAAHAALERFVASALAMGLRRALVITGKGQGILRAAVPRWLATPPLNNLVAATGRAAVRHGGEGAFYLMIRRPERPTASPGGAPGGAKRKR